jgi:NADPH:quinone reductase-like Zn-dependent oxidoreductase
MRAAQVPRTGPADSVRVGPLPVPRPGPGDVVVEVDLTVVNNVDTFVRSGAYRTDLPLPFVVGRDLVGTVIETGSAVDRFAVGDRVWSNSLGHDGRQGAAAERALVPVDRLYALPAGVDPAVAVAIAHPAATAHLALVHGRVVPASGAPVVVVTGAGGNVGSATVVLAARAGARVVAVAAADDAGYCRSLGAEHVVDYRDPDLAGALTRVAPDGVDVWVDVAGVNDLPLAVDRLAPRGRIVLLAGAGARPELPVGALYMKDVSVHGFAISNATVDELAAAAAAVNGLLTEDRLRPRAVEVAGLERTGALHRRVEDHGQHGTRFLIDPRRKC